ncbi:hypothetical protein BEN44_01475 [Leptospira interrogans serovar Ricardi]|nr:hypothetical protein [Leptospira interrogans serovar Ricardi]
MFFNFRLFFRRNERADVSKDLDPEKSNFHKGRSAKLFPKNVARLREHRETIFLTLTYVVLEFSNF